MLLSARRSGIVIARRRFGHAPFSSSTSTVAPATSSSSATMTNLEEGDHRVEGKELLLYKGNKGTYIKGMLGLAGFNVCYWTTLIAADYFYKAPTIDGATFLSNPWWGYMGGIASAGIFYVTKKFSQNSVYKAYLSADGERLGFQMHTIIGSPGRKVEFALGNAKLLQKVSKADMDKPGQSGFLSTTALPVSVEGLEFNALLDKKGTYYENAMILDLLTAPDELKNVASKQDRLAWKKGGKTIAHKGKKH